MRVCVFVLQSTKDLASPWVKRSWHDGTNRLGLRLRCAAMRTVCGCAWERDGVRKSMLWLEQNSGRYLSSSSVPYLLTIANIADKVYNLYFPEVTRLFIWLNSIMLLCFLRNMSRPDPQNLPFITSVDSSVGKMWALHALFQQDAVSIESLVHNGHSKEK